MNQITRGFPKTRIAAIACFFICLLASGSALAAVIDFEDGTDGAVIASTIPGLEFTTTQGFDWVYGDWRSGDYNGPYPNGSYYSFGNFFAWLGEYQDDGIITFTQSYATYVEVGYSTYTTVYLTAYDYMGNQLDQDTGTYNLDTGRMDYLRVEAPGMAYVIVHGDSNYWLIDNLETDAITDCLEDSDCDDGEWCNGQELCQQYICVDGTPVDCPDDGLYCNGTEFCDEDNDMCSTTGDPCPGDDGLWCTGDEYCDEDTDTCEATGNPCPEGTECSEDDDECLTPEDLFEAENPGIYGSGGCGA